jgi:dTDP-4-dehydrorhamnose reductase
VNHRGITVRIFITGHDGQLGSALQHTLLGHTVDGASLPTGWDMTDLPQVMERFQAFRPNVVIHTAALTNVDYCAQHPNEALRVNGVGSYNVALGCRAVNATMIAISTNEVFDGRASVPYQEYDRRNPINAYGASKLVAEQVIERFAPRYMIVRTAWLFAPGGVNFIHKILARARAGEPVRVVTDEVGSPTYAPDLAQAIAGLIERNQPGLFHLVNSGECSRYEFARTILECAGLGDVAIEPIRSSDFSRPSVPPLYCPLATSLPPRSALRPTLAGGGERLSYCYRAGGWRVSQTTTPPRVSVVIPNWNGIQHLPICLDSLRAQTYHNHQVIVVDNASNDGSQALVVEQYPEVCLIALPENRGFTGACNAGIAASGGQIIVLLNNDTEAAPAWLEEVVLAFGRHTEAGMIASKMLLFDRRDTLHTAGDFYRVDGMPGNRGVWQKDGEAFQHEVYVFSACGGTAAYRRALLDEIGVLDDDFFFSCEDVDLGWRAQLTGWRCVYAPKAVVYHHLAATGGGATASFYDGRNTIWVIAKNYPSPLLRKHWRKVVSAQLRRGWAAIRAWRGKAARATLWGMWSGLFALPRMLGKRRHIQGQRRVSLEYLDEILSAVE